MPKRTNRFQQLITLIEHSLQGQGANVFESRELIDRVTGQPREVDIVIERTSGTHSLVIGVECTGISDKKRGRLNPATIEWVERMIAKHQGLPTDKLVLVSEKGFTRRASEKAALHNVSAYSLTDAGRVDWGSLFGKLTEMRLVGIVQPYDRHIVVFPSVPDAPRVDEAQLFSLIVHDAEGKALAALSGIVNGIFHFPEVRQAIENLPNPNATYTLTLNYGFAAGAYLALQDGQKWPIASLRITAKCRKEVNTINLSHGQYGDAAVAHGEGQFLGRPVKLVVTQRPHENSLSVVLEHEGPKTKAGGDG